MSVINYIFNVGFLPHGYCFQWDTLTLWLTIVGNLGIGIAYMVIPLKLWFFVKKQDAKALRPYKNIIVLFALFIFSCGISHFFDILTIWLPWYRLAGAERIWTAIISIFAAAVLGPIVRRLKINVYKLRNNSVQITEIELPPTDIKATKP